LHGVSSEGNGGTESLGSRRVWHVAGILQKSANLDEMWRSHHTELISALEKVRMNNAVDWLCRHTRERRDSSVEYVPGHSLTTDGRCHRLRGSREIQVRRAVG
jgi:hypothetical protein